jgi:hypothetical protein
VKIVLRADSGFCREELMGWCEANHVDYGTYIPRIGQMLLVDRYDDRTHFVYELLQNAEDALARRVGWTGSRAIKFSPDAEMLRLSHFGQPFDGRDVRGICGIAESSKDLTAIGRFGIGFKSVYAYTSHPEVHSSGDEDFVIESFVWPSAAPPIDRDPNETVILLPLKSETATARAEIARGLQQLGPRTLLFLREIDEIEWHVENGPSGMYLRSTPQSLGDGVRRITLVGQEAAKQDVEESWLIFFKEISTDEGIVVGQIEIAFSIAESNQGSGWSIQPVASSQLVVFFPTIVPTNLAFLVQGPYRTRPSRDNVPQNDLWNQKLIRETESLLTKALTWLRNNGRLDVSCLRCLPLDRTEFPVGHRFVSIFESVRQQFKSSPFLPTSSSTYVAANAVKLARTQDLRVLISPKQLGTLFGAADELSWLTGDISQDRTPDNKQTADVETNVSRVPEERCPRMALRRSSGWRPSDFQVRLEVKR